MADEPTCRICMENTDLSLGKLFSPCLCNGSMKYVHTQCLHRWRQTSQNRNSFYRCDQCHYNYRIGRVDAYNFLQNKFIQSLISLGTLFLIILISGYIVGGNSIIDKLFFGSILMGIIGFFGLFIKVMCIIDLAFFRFPFGIFNEKNIKQISTIIVIVGLLWLIWQIYKCIEWGCNKIINMTSEEILEVRR